MWRLGIGWGVPATLVGAVLTSYVGGGFLVAVSDALILALGIRVLWSAWHDRTTDMVERPEPSTTVVALVAVAIGVTSGLLANSGGALLAPLYLTVLHMPIKRAFATSLAAATVLAVPATAVHAALGHIDWTVVAVFAAASIPLSGLGSRLAVHSESVRLQRVYGAVLTMLGVGFIAGRFI